MLIDITDTVQLTHTAAEVDADIDGSVRGDIAQLKDNTWKEQARENIGAGSGSGGGGNLLINPFFTVNQRDITNNWSPYAYGVDRWKGWSVTPTVSNGRLNMPAQCLIFQIVENLSALNGKTLTMSVKGDFGIKKTTFTFNSETTTIETIGDLVIGYNSSIGFEVWNNGSNNIVIEAVKLELGSVSTLANDIAPNYAEELAKCQRYFVRLNQSQGTVLGNGYNLSAALAKILVPLPVPMRNVTPTLSPSNLTSGILLKSNGASITPSAVTTYLTQERATITLDFTASGLSANHTVSARVNVDSYFDISCDL